MNKLSKSGLSIIVLAICLITMAFTINSDGVTLRLNLEKGKIYTAHSKTNMMTMMDVQGQTMSMPQNVESTLSFEVKDFAGGQYTIASALNKLKFSQSQMGMNFSYDSEHPEATSPLLVEATSAIQESINKPYDITIDERGKIIKNSTDQSLGQFADNGSFFLEFPEEAVNVGSTWTIEKDLNANGLQGKVNMTYTISEINKKKVVLTFLGTLSGENSAKGTYEGTYNIDKVSGMIMEGNVKANMSMTVSESGMEIPMTISSNSEITTK